MGGLSIWHWLVVLAAVAIIFGVGRIGNVMGEVGKGIKNFKSAMNEDEPKKSEDASMAATGTLGAPHVPPQGPIVDQNSTVNQG